jgi:hypothetical protein
MCSDKRTDVQLAEPSRKFKDLNIKLRNISLAINFNSW